jgi:hypothetical protein
VYASIVDVVPMASMKKPVSVALALEEVIVAELDAIFVVPVAEVDMVWAEVSEIDVLVAEAVVVALDPANAELETSPIEVDTAATLERDSVAEVCAEEVRKVELEDAVVETVVDAASTEKVDIFEVEGFVIKVENVSVSDLLPEVGIEDVSTAELEVTPVIAELPVMVGRAADSDGDVEVMTYWEVATPNDELV